MVPLRSPTHRGSVEIKSILILPARQAEPHAERTGPRTPVRDSETSHGRVTASGSFAASDRPDDSWVPALFPPARAFVSP